MIRIGHSHILHFRGGCSPPTFVYVDLHIVMPILTDLLSSLAFHGPRCSFHNRLTIRIPSHICIRKTANANSYTAHTEIPITNIYFSRIHRTHLRIKKSQHTSPCREVGFNERSSISESHWCEFPPTGTSIPNLILVLPIQICPFWRIITPSLTWKNEGPEQFFCLTAQTTIWTCLSIDKSGECLNLHFCFLLFAQLQIWIFPNSKNANLKKQIYKFPSKFVHNCPSYLWFPQVPMTNPPKSTFFPALSPFVHNAKGVDSTSRTRQCLHSYSICRRG